METKYLGYRFSSVKITASGLWIWFAGIHLWIQQTKHLQCTFTFLMPVLISMLKYDTLFCCLSMTTQPKSISTSIYNQLTWSCCHARRRQLSKIDKYKVHPQLGFSSYLSIWRAVQEWSWYHLVHNNLSLLGFCKQTKNLAKWF